MTKEVDPDGTEWYFMCSREEGRRGEQVDQRDKSVSEPGTPQKDSKSFDWAKWAILSPSGASGSQTQPPALPDEHLGEALQDCFDKGSKLQLECQVAGQKLAQAGHKAGVLVVCLSSS